jgi:hypothetical protein
MHRLLSLSLLVALALVFSGSAFAGPNLISNGGFEQPPVGGGYQLFSVGQSFPGWQVVGTPGANVAPISAPSVRTASSSPPSPASSGWI